VQGKNVVTTDH